ncbi:MAG: 16S rRNA (cytosine1402-N4)-methyltransferase [Paraglaciecola psychrophila]|jgi:16S rRNA (cytosine1402-N4)-methyltransferase
MAGHETVLLQGAVDALITDPAGVYVDGTFGRGGHSREILTRIDAAGQLFGIDKDPQAIAVGLELQQEDSRFAVIQGSFADLGEAIDRQPFGSFDGILLDLGVSSPQLDQADRGFSFMRDGDLDMRMNPQVGVSAAEWLAVAAEADIAKVLKEYGEERYAKRLANAVVTAREKGPITTTVQLAELLKLAHPAWERGKHPATKSFQAIRIYINNEMTDLTLFLDRVLDVLKVGGRLVVISFHSLEDRQVKRFIKKHVRGDDFPANVPVTVEQLNRRLKHIGKAIKADSEEVGKNVRSRSAVMRVAEKIA